MASSETRLPNSLVRGSLWSMTGRAQVVTFIGAGGKTTCLRALIREIGSAGHRVIATTTTKVFPEELMKGWKNSNPPPYEQEGACFWYVDVMAESGKWIGPSLEAVDAAIGRARAVLDVGAIHELPLHASPSQSASQRTVPNLHNLHNLYWVIEGDGARGLKLKCWGPHEPQIPRRSNCVVLVLDGGLWGRVLQAEKVHRPAGCLDLLGQVWNAEQAWRYFLRSPVFAPQYEQMSWVILLNTHRKNQKNEDLIDLRHPFDPLLDLGHKWMELQRQAFVQKSRPNHLRLAAGDAKEGEIKWFDLW